MSHPPEAELPLKSCWQRVFIKGTHNEFTRNSPAAAMAALPHSQHCTGSLPQRKLPLLERKKKSRAHLGKPQLRLQLCVGLMGTSPALPRPLPGCGLSPRLILFLPLFILRFLLQLLCAPRPLLPFMSKVLAWQRHGYSADPCFPPGVFSLESQVSLVCNSQEMLCCWLPSCCLCITIPLLKPLQA